MMNESSVDVSRMVKEIREIVPQIEEKIIVELLSRNSYEIDRTVDALLALSTTLEKEKGLLILSSPGKQNCSEESKKPQYVLQHPLLPSPSVSSCNTTDESDEIVGEAKIIRNVKNEIATIKTTTPTSKSAGSRSVSDMPSLERKMSSDALVQSPFSSETRTSSRGTPMVLPKSFLNAPRFRIVSHKVEDDFSSFVIMFNRKNHKLGITIQEVNSQIKIVAIQQRNSNTLLLAQAAGVKIGDVLVGINNEPFGPWAELQDVMDLLSLSGHFVTMHFIRYDDPAVVVAANGGNSAAQRNSMKFKSSSAKQLVGVDTLASGLPVAIADSGSLPKRMKLFVENSVLTPEQIPLMERTISYLKGRVVKWSSAMLAKKIEEWKLDPTAHQEQRQQRMLGADSTVLGLTVAEDVSSSPSTSSKGNTQQESAAKTGDTLESSRSAPRGGINRRHTIDPATLKKRDSSDKVSSEACSQQVLTNRRNSITTVPSIIALDDGQRYLEGYTAIETQNLRPAISLRILRAEQGRGGDFIVYVIWVLDVKSGEEWFIRRRFREFEVFRETIVGIRKKLQSLDFPQKHMAAVTEKSLIIQERLITLQRFLRRIAGIITLNSHHPSTIKLHMALQRFLALEDHLDMIVMKESDPAQHLSKTIEVFVHNILHLSLMDRALLGFINTFMSTPVEDVHRKWSEREARHIADELKGFLDRLQTFLGDSLMDDCIDIVNDVLREGGSQMMPQQASKFIERLNMTAISLNTSSKKHPKKIISSSESNSPTHVPKSLDVATAGQREMGDVEDETTEEDSPRSKDLRAQEEQQRLRDESNAAQHCEYLIESTTDEFRTVILSAVRRQVEVEVYLATFGRLDFVLQQVYQKEDDSFLERVMFLSHLPQTYYGIPVELISPSSWAGPIITFREILKRTLPCDKIDSLAEVSRSIVQLYREEHVESPTALGADDLLPIFIYIIVQAQVPNLISLHNGLQYLCAEDKRLSEAGYYLATLQASIAHIMEADLGKERPFFMLSEERNED